MSDAIGSSPTGDYPPSGVGLTTQPQHLTETVHEAYSFACLRCGYGWEQAYEIEHHVARDGTTTFEYRAGGVRVPSPLRHPTCPGCGGDKVRIMREGRVASAESFWHHAPGYPAHAEPGEAPQVTQPPAAQPPGARPAAPSATAQPAESSPPPGLISRFRSRRRSG